VKWFPDRRGLATGLAIMGFGFASLLAGPIIQKLIVTIGLPYTFFVLGAGYFVIIFASSQYLSPPPAGWTPKGLQTGIVSAGQKIRSDLSQLNADEAVKTRRFYWLWLMLFINVTCGIAIISVASAMAQEAVGMSAAEAAVMVGLMGLFNGAGRIAWASFSDYIGRPNTYTLFFALQMAMFFLLLKMPDPFSFQLLILLIMTCYGGGFSCIPAYIADLFGTKQLGAIHGYVLTAWAAAGLAGPILVAWIRQVSGSYAGIIMIFLGLFVLAFIISLIIRLDISRLNHMQECEKADSITERTFDADLSEVTATIDFVSKWAREAGFDSGKIARLELAVEEAAANICSHAYLEESAINTMSYAYHRRSSYTVGIMNEADSFAVRITDSGIAFDPLRIAPPDMSSPVEVRRADGLGIFLMRKMVDDVRYERTKDRNMLTLIIRKN
jgi:anti-sigma regulatory factor (Ser/Thr protein kinase)